MTNLTEFSAIAAVQEKGPSVCSGWCTELRWGSNAWRGRERVPAPATLLSLRGSGSILPSEKLSLCLARLLEQCCLGGGVSLRGWALAGVQGSAAGSLGSRSHRCRVYQVLLLRGGNRVLL